MAITGGPNPLDPRELAATFLVGIVGIALGGWLTYFTQLRMARVANTHERSKEARALRREVFAKLSGMLWAVERLGTSRIRLKRDLAAATYFQNVDPGRAAKFQSRAEELVDMRQRIFESIAIAEVVFAFPAARTKNLRSMTDHDFKSPSAPPGMDAEAATDFYNKWGREERKRFADEFLEPLSRFVGNMRDELQESLID